MLIENVLASVAVEDLDRSIVWYERLLGRPPDSRPMSDVAEWRFVGGGWLQVYQLPARSGAGSFTLAVRDIEPIRDHVSRLGIDTSRRTSSQQVDTLMITDPDGNHIAFARAHDPSLAR